MIMYGSICNLINMLIIIDQGRSSNFAHPAIIELCKKFYYGGKADSLATLFPEEFKTLPRGSLAMACTCVSSHFAFCRHYSLSNCYRSLIACMKWKWGQEPTFLLVAPDMNQSTIV